MKKFTFSIFTVLLLSACQYAPVASPQKAVQVTTKKENTEAKVLADEVVSADMDLSGRHEYVLDNGLKVVIKEDHRAPVVVTQIWYRVGSSDEPEDKGGISHLLEHMMFKGTKKVSSDDFERMIAKFGGHNNAFTSYDYTGYYEVFPANYWTLALELEADRMKNLQFDENDFVKEHQVVMEERRQRTDDNPLAVAVEQFNLLAMPDSPKGESVIGPMKEIESIKLDELKHWYETWYAPNNATLVIVGDVNAKQAIKEVKKYFGNIEPVKLPKRPSVKQAGFRGYQQTVSRQAVQVPVLLMAYNVPTLTVQDSKKDSQAHAHDAYSLALLADVLDGGLSSRLESRLVREKGILSSVSSGYNLFDRGDGLFVIQAAPRDGVSLSQAQAAILHEIEALKNDPILPKEIERSKTNTITGLVYSQDSMAGQAQMIGSLQSIGLDDRMVAKLPAQFDKVSVKDIKDVAKKYLVKNNLTVMYVEPKQ